MRYSLLVVVLLLSQIVGCNDDIDKKKGPKKYGSKTKLFLGYELGMKKKEFYDHSWKLNDKRMVKQGPRNQSVKYELEDELSHPAIMYFYPNFHNERVYQMRVKFQYSNWAPWNKNLYSDSLQVDVIKLFKKWYGGGFKQMEGKGRFGKRIVHVKKDKNRRIVVTTDGSREVVAIITDIVAEKEVKENDK